MGIIDGSRRFIVRKLTQLYERAFFDDSTIALKFRRQGAKIGENCFFQIRNLAAEPYLVEIGNNVAIGADVKLFTHDGASVVFREEHPFLRYFGKIVIEDDCFVGEGAIITAGVRIGRYSIIAPRAVVLADVRPGSVMIGNPAIRLSTTERYREKCLQLWKSQGLDLLEKRFEGKSKYEVQDVITSSEFQMELKRHLLSREL